jgi:hypothetical protein
MKMIMLTKESDLGLNGNEIVLKPGLNGIDDAAWEKVGSLEMTKILLSKGIITEVAPVAPQKIEPEPIKTVEVAPVAEKLTGATTPEGQPRAPDTITDAVMPHKGKHWRKGRG